MFSKISRYRKLADDVTVDSRERELVSKSLRHLPEVPGKFLHTIAATDRLDHLGYKYYKQSRNWWRICDANPEFMSPRALLGKEPLITQYFPVQYAGPEAVPPWAGLFVQLRARPGVENALLEEDIDLITEIQEINGERITVVLEEQHHRSLRITYNQLNISLTELGELIAANGFEVLEPQHIGRVGKQIIIPPPAVG